MSLAAKLFRLARVVNTARHWASCNPVRILRHTANRKLLKHVGGKIQLRRSK